jgi:chromosomal replication initiator protein
VNSVDYPAMSMNHEDPWLKITAFLKERAGETAFETWIKPLQHKFEGTDTLILKAPDTFFREWVEKNYGGHIQEAARLFLSAGVSIQIETGGEPQPQQQPENPKEVYPGHAAPSDGLALNPRYTFENFVIGPSNRHSHAYSLAVAQSPAKIYNPLFIYGGVGLGKTHLIQAICHHIRNKGDAPKKICYLSSEKFTNELIDAIQHHSTPAFRQKYRNVDVLVIDDIHFIAGKESTQEEFFHTFNALYDAHKQIIISSDRPPKEINNLQERLVSRFNWGLTTDIQPPDLETRVAILKKKVEREPVIVPDEVIFFIAQLIKTNIRELEGALIRTIAYSLLEEKAINLELAKEILKDLMKEPQKLITVDFIQRCVSEEFGITLSELRTKKRNKNIVVPRQIAMYLSMELTDMSLPEIGASFGGKDHTTVLHSYNKIKNDLINNPDLKNQVNKVIRIIQQ